MQGIRIGAVLAALLASCTQPTTGNDAAVDNSATTPAGAALAVTRVSLPGEGRGDYIAVDAAARRLYVTHSAAVHILDLDTLAPIAQVTGLGAAHGVALADGHGFVTDGDRGTVVQFDLATGRTLKIIPTGKKPDSILTDAATGNVFVFNGESDDVSVINPETAVVIKTIKLPYGPEFSQSDGKGRIWVNMADGNAIAVIDARSMAMVGTIPLTGCEDPAPLGFDGGNRLLFSGCGNGVMVVVDADAGTVIATVPIGEGGDADGIAVDAERKRIVVANRNGGWTIIRQNSRTDYVVEQTLKIDDYAKTVTVDPTTHRLFSSTADLVWPPAVPGKKHLPNARSGSFRLMIVSEH